METQAAALGGVLPGRSMKLKSDATTWVMRDQNGQMARIKVVDMSDAHLFRWIRYFRKKYRDEGFQGDDATLDATIRVSIVTAPAIFAEATKRGVYLPPVKPATVASAAVAAPQPEVLPAPPGKRLITLEDEE